MSKYRSDFEAAGDWLAGTARRHPEAVLVLAAGCILLLRGRGDDKDRPASRGGARGKQGSRLNEVSETVRERVTEVAETAAEYAADVGDRVYDTAASYASAASDFADEGRRIVTRQASRAAGQARHAADRVLTEQPLAVAVLGLAAGAGLAALLPPSDIEERALSPAHDKLSDAASRTAERLKDAAGEMGKQIKVSVAERVLSGDIAKEAAQAFAHSLNRDEDRDADDARRGSSG
jgi:hypothetical protein